MPPLQPVKTQTLIHIFEADGWTRARQKGSHLSLTKPGYKRPVVIVTGKKESEVWLIQTNLRTAGMSRERYFELLSRVS